LAYNVLGSAALLRRFCSVRRDSNTRKRPEHRRPPSSGLRRGKHAKTQASIAHHASFQ
jgi:hypothetical protein